jgi:hypothetical protein
MHTSNDMAAARSCPARIHAGVMVMQHDSAPSLRKLQDGWNDTSGAGAELWFSMA